MSQQSEYQSYLLRLWRSGKSAAWRILLEQIGSGERWSFPDLESLLVFLQARTDQAMPQDDGGETDRE
jgi:hypothetical protein